MSQLLLVDDNNIKEELMPLKDLKSNKKKAFPVNLAEEGRFVADELVIFDSEQVAHKTFEGYKKQGAITIMPQDLCLKIWRRITASKGEPVDILGVTQEKPEVAICTTPSRKFGVNPYILKTVNHLCKPTGYYLPHGVPVLVARVGESPVAGIAIINLEEESN